MIRFACKQCGKVHERPDETAGTLVFCDCGQGNRVPWESTVAGEEAPAPPESREDIPRVRAEEGEEEPELEHRGRRRPRWREAPARDPAYCLNHPDTRSTHTCAACAETFCDDCVVTLQGEALCGPCKNFRLRRVHKAGHISVLAVLSLVAALVGGGAGMFIVLTAVGMRSPAAGWLGLLPLAIALVLGAVALRQIESNPKVIGRSLAITAVVTAVGGAFLMAFLIVLMQRSLE